MRERLAERAEIRHLSREAPGQRGEELLVFRLSRTEHHHLHRTPREEARQDVEAKIEAFLPGEARHDADDRHLTCVRQVRAREQRLLVQLLAAQIFARVAMREESVAVRAPLVLVDAVEDPEEHVRALAQVGIEPDAVLRPLHLARVAGAHRGDGIRVEQPREEEVDPTLAQLILVEVMRRRREPDVREHARVERALVPDVVDGEHGARLREQAIPRKHAAQEERQERGLPVVGVHDVGPEAEPLADAERRPREHREAEMLVVVLRVDAVSPIEPRAVNEVDGHRGPGQHRRVHREHDPVRPELEHHLADHELGVVGVLDPPVHRHDHAHVVGGSVGPGAARTSKCPRQSRCDVAESPGLGERRHLGGDEEHVHGRTL